MSLTKSTMRVDLVCTMTIICDKCLGIVSHVRSHAGIWALCWIPFSLSAHCLSSHSELCLGSVFFITFRGRDDMISSMFRRQ